MKLNVLRFLLHFDSPRRCAKGKRKGHQDQGMNWIRQDKRLAIYLRDGCACAYCGAGIESGAQLTLDHLRCVSRGGDNKAANLVTACHGCNTARKNDSLTSFVVLAAQWHKRTSTGIVRHLANCIARPISIPAARKLMALRDTKSAAQALAK